MTVELNPLTEVHGCVMGRCTVCPVQWGMEKGKQEGHRENQRCHYLGEAARLAEVEFSCLLLLAIVCLLIFLPLLLRPHPIPSFPFYVITTQRVALSFLISDSSFLFEIK